ncbi:MAG: FG-GAP-like repeat-containing protein, partial [Bacteroidota bacterium]
TLFVLVLSPSLLVGQILFTDIAPTAGVADAGNGQGVAMFDFNNDGYLDIYLVNNGQSNKLFRNNGNLTYTEVGATFGVNNTGAGRGCAIGDYNNDGRPDIVVGNFNQGMILYRNDSTVFTNATAIAGMSVTSWGGSINWLDYNADGRLDCYVGNNGIPPHYNYLFRNDNLSSFTHVAFAMGLNDSSSTLSTASADYDNDGDMDIFIGNQAFPTGILYRNDGTTFTNVTASSGLSTVRYTWGADWGDFDNDSDLDMYLANSNGPNELFRNNGDGTFMDVATTFGVADPIQSFSCGWADVDNDGDLDLYVANSTAGLDRMYRNDGTTFTDVAAASGMIDPLLSSSTTWGDINNDGRIDLYLSNNGTANKLWLNGSDSTKHWLQLKLTGTASNRSAIGARVRVRTGSLNQIREVQGGSGHNGQNSLPVEFGLNTATLADSVIIRWPNGSVRVLTAVPADQILNISETPTSVERTSPAVPDRFVLEQNYPNPFNPTTEIEYSLPSLSSNQAKGRVGEGSHVRLGEPSARRVTLKVYDLLGREVATLVNENLKPGTYHVEWNASAFASGIYLCQLRAGALVQTIKLSLVR